MQWRAPTRSSLVSRSSTTTSAIRCPPCPIQTPRCSSSTRLVSAWSGSRRTSALHQCPEPGSVLLLGLGLVGATLLRILRPVVIQRFL
ncbi:MAG: hypothetical protein DMD96_10405 [Candidatus Rokuibacteriota bacterium]|nr:MAG: hypothetical protein DMD96_10405 [Candidatus Rokubacteria bacterium]